MRGVCEGLGWEAGEMWQVDSDGERIRPAGYWPPGAAPALLAAGCNLALRRGEGLPGRCWQEQAIVWMEDVQTDAGFVRKASARQEQLHGALAFPLIANNTVLGVVQFFSKTQQQPQEELVHMLSSLGNQLGEYLVRNRSELLLRQSE